MDERFNKLLTRSKEVAKSSIEQAIRHRYFPELWYLTENWFSIVKDRKVLEIGCGQGYLSEALVRSGWQLCATDPSVAALVAAKSKLGEGAKNANFEQSLPEALKAASASFEAVVCANILEFSQQPLQALKEIERVLVPGGRAVISTFNKLSPWGLPTVARGMRPAGELPLNVQCLSRDEFIGLLRASNLKVVELKERAQYLPAPAKGLMAVKLPVAGAFIALVSKRRTRKKSPATPA